MLKEADIDRHTRWSDVKRKFDSDPRYKIVESGVQREDWFRDFVMKVNYLLSASSVTLLWCLNFLINSF